MNTRRIPIIHSMLLLLLLAACGSPRSTTPGPAPETTAVAPAAATERVEFSGISFTYDRDLADQVESSRMPAGEHMGTQLPEYVEFDFDGDRTHPFPGRATGIRVFRVRDLEQVNWMYRAGVAAREPMPLLNATRILRVQEKLLSFQNGKGTRAILHYAQDLSPLNNEDLFYSYQGVTDNGLYYVSATFPLKAEFLPATFQDDFPGKPATTPMDFEAYADAVNGFNRDAAERLERLNQGNYTPNLDQLDALIRSLFAGEAPDWSVNPEQ